MNIDEIRSYCLSLTGATEDFPFDETTLVFKVGDKMFALIDLEDPSWINLKCDPELAITIREEYSSVTPGYHMNKKHWNTIHLDGSFLAKLLIEWINNSYWLIRNSLTKAKRRKLDLLEVKIESSI